MTLIVSVATQQMIVQASDRRVTTSENGIRYVLDDECNKAIYLHCRDAQACISFAGVAYIGDIPTSEFIANHLGAANVSEMLLEQVIRELEGPVIHALRHRENEWGFPHQSMVVLSAYQYSGLPGPKQKHRSVHGSIATGPDAPWVNVVDNEGCESIRIFGMIQAIESSLKERLVSLSQQSFFHTSDSATVADQLVDVIRTAAKQRYYGDAIGSNCLSMTLYSNPTMRAESRYHPAGQPAQNCIPLLLIVGNVPLPSLPPEVIHDGRVNYPIKYFTDQDLFRRYREVAEKLGLPPGYSGPLVLSETDDD
jgi:hypothetical protein